MIVYTETKYKSLKKIHIYDRAHNKIAKSCTKITM